MSERQIVLASRNRKKVNELRQILDGLPYEILTLDHFPDCPEVLEDGETFESNALKKAEEVSRYTGLWAVADDSGLEVDYLGGEPGVYSARYGGFETDAERNRYLLEKLDRVPTIQRKARFVCHATLFGDGKILYRSVGVCPGTILEKPVGEGGFGYDPIFRPEGFSCSMAELSPEEKHRISHRGKAFRLIRDFLMRRGDKCA